MLRNVISLILCMIKEHSPWPIRWSGLITHILLALLIEFVVWFVTHYLLL